METLLQQKLNQVANRFRSGRFAMWLLLFWTLLLVGKSLLLKPDFQFSSTFSALLAIFGIISSLFLIFEYALD